MEAPAEEDMALTFQHELDVFFPKIGDFYRAICLYNGAVAELCPNNENSLCKTLHPARPRDLYHPWDGKNAWKCNCG
jgi:hypothetical protein